MRFLSNYFMIIMNTKLNWENYIDIKEQEIKILEQEILELEQPNYETPESTPKKAEDALNNVESKPYLEKLKDIFYRYASIFSSNEIFLNITHFKIFFTELCLGTKDLTWKKAELIYHSISKRSNIDFIKFQKILRKLTFERFKTNDLSKLLHLLKIPEKRLDLIDKNIEIWTEQAKCASVKEVISGFEDLLRIVYSVYGSKDVRIQNLINLPKFLEFCSDSKIIPKFVSNIEVARLFRSLEYDGSLNYEQFLQVFSNVSMLAMAKEGITYPADSLKYMLDYLGENSDYLFNKNKESSRWNIEAQGID